MNIIWWIRRDLRLADNAALAAALENLTIERGVLIPVFIIDPILIQSMYTGAERLDFMFAGLRLLAADLTSRGSRLLIREGNPLEELGRLLVETDSVRIFAEADHSPYARRRDGFIAERLPLSLVGSPLVFPPDIVLKPDRTPYTVFTPFSKAWKSLPLPGLPRPTPDALPKLALEELPGCLAQKTDSRGMFRRQMPNEQASFSLFPPGESRAISRLRIFTQGSDAPIYRYQETHDLFDGDHTSRLSPYLRFGMLSARQVAYAAFQAVDTAPDVEARHSAETWLNELIWREFFVNILYYFPHVLRQSFRPELRQIAWENNQLYFDAWRVGRTGYPVVDAAMRQLIDTGWMHNRARMIAASFLVKDLLIDWRWGERWFMQHLLDGDPAANNGGWQWIAGTGTDAVPYFRVFNPITQGLKFDPQGAYVRRWVPELAHVPDEYIHEPWRMSGDIQETSGCLIGTDYPAPIVDHATARQRTLQVYQLARNSAS